METKTPRQLKKEAKEKEKLRRPLRTVVHPTRIIAYLVQLAIAYYVHDFLRNHFMLLVMWVILLLPIFDLITFILLYRGVRVELSAPEREVNRNSVGYLNLKMINTSYLISYDVNIKLDVENSFYNDSSATLLSLPISARCNEDKQIPIKYSMQGSAHRPQTAGAFSILWSIQCFADRGNSLSKTRLQSLTKARSTHF